MGEECELDNCFEDVLLILALLPLPVGVLALILCTKRWQKIRAKSADKKEIEYNPTACEKDADKCERNEYDLEIYNSIYDKPSVNSDNDHDTANYTTGILCKPTLPNGGAKNQHADEEPSFEIYNTDYGEVGPDNDGKCSFVIYNDEYVDYNKSLANGEYETCYEEYDMIDNDVTEDNKRDIAYKNALTPQAQGNSLSYENALMR